LSARESPVAPGEPVSARIAVLDAFRALAISGVLVYHFLWAWQAPSNLYGYAHRYPHWLSLGGLGVQFFFIISGFVILMTLERCRSLPEFWWRRFARIYPAYLVVIVVSFLITNRFGPEPFRSSSSDLLAGLLLLSPDLTGGTFVDLAFWSLVVEAQFYFWIGLIYLLANRHFTAAWTGLTAFALLCWLLGALEPFHFLRALRHPLFLLSHLSYFTAGMAFYELYCRRKRSCYALSAAALAAYAVVALHAPWPRHLAVVLMVAAFLLFIARKVNWLAVRPLLFLGTISYSLYLIHQNFGVILIARLTRMGAPDMLAAAAAALTCIAIASLLTRWVEVPAKRALLQRMRNSLAVPSPVLTFRRPVADRRLVPDMARPDASAR
jgi:peptidoglycan/LPS O-acetylase OafA/YrhL